MILRDAYEPPQLNFLGWNQGGGLCIIKTPARAGAMHRVCGQSCRSLDLIACTADLQRVTPLARL